MKCDKQNTEKRVPHYPLGLLFEINDMLLLPDAIQRLKYCLRSAITSWFDSSHHISDLLGGLIRTPGL